VHHEESSPRNARPKAERPPGRGLRRDPWAWLIASLFVATSLALATVAVWLVPVYWAVLAALILDLAALNSKLGALALGSSRRRAPTRTLAMAGTEAAPLPIPDVVDRRPDDSPSADGALAAPEAVAVDVEANAPRPRRGRGRGRARTAADVPPAPPSVNWVRVGPGKFVRVEGAAADLAGPLLASAEIDASLDATAQAFAPEPIAAIPEPVPVASGAPAEPSVAADPTVAPDAPPPDPEPEPATENELPPESAVAASSGDIDLAQTEPVADATQADADEAPACAASLPIGSEFDDEAPAQAVEAPASPALRGSAVDRPWRFRTWPDRAAGRWSRRGSFPASRERPRRTPRPRGCDRIARSATSRGLRRARKGRPARESRARRSHPTRGPPVHSTAPHAGEDFRRRTRAVARRFSYHRERPDPHD
jgi:hypothetical protein